MKARREKASQGRAIPHDPGGVFLEAVLTLGFPAFLTFHGLLTLSVTSEKGDCL